MKTITLEPAVHKGERRIKLRFGYDDRLISLVKKISGSAWSRTMKALVFDLSCTYPTLFRNNHHRS